MPFLTIAGTTVEMTAFSEKKPEYRGESVRAFDNTLLSGKDGRRRQWGGTTYPMTPTAAEALREATKNGARVACTGSALRGLTYTCEVEVEGAEFGPDVSQSAQDWTGHGEALTLTLTEA